MKNSIIHVLQKRQIIIQSIKPTVATEYGWFLIFHDPSIVSYKQPLQDEKNKGPIVISSLRRNNHSGHASHYKCSNQTAYSTTRVVLSKPHCPNDKRHIRIHVAQKSKSAAITNYKTQTHPLT